MVARCGPRIILMVKVLHLHLAYHSSPPILPHKLQRYSLVDERLGFEAAAVILDYL
jgi:hypothetical protein